MYKFRSPMIQGAEIIAEYEYQTIDFNFHFSASDVSNTSLSSINGVDTTLLFINVV